MNVFAEADRWRARNLTVPAGPPGPWRAFARLASGELRFRAQAHGARIQVQRPCYYVPGKWRVAGHVRVAAWVYDSTHWTQPLTLAQAEAVLVLRDAWLEAGAKVVTRLPVVIGSAP